MNNMELDEDEYKATRELYKKLSEQDKEEIKNVYKFKEKYKKGEMEGE